MSFTAEMLKVLSAYEGVTDLFVLKQDGGNVKVSGWNTKNKISDKTAALVVEAPKRHFDAGDDVGFLEFSKFYSMLDLTTGGKLESAAIEVKKTNSGISGFEWKTPNMDSTAEYRVASLDSCEFNKSLWTGFRKGDEHYSSIPDSLVKAKFSLTKANLDMIFAYGGVIDAKTVTLEAKDDNVTFYYINSITGNKMKFSLEAEVKTPTTTTIAVDLLRKVPKENYKAVLAGNVMTWEQIMPPVGEGDKAVPSDIVVRTCFYGQAVNA